MLVEQGGCAVLGRRVTELDRTADRTQRDLTVPELDY